MLERDAHRDGKRETFHHMVSAIRLHGLLVWQVPLPAEPSGWLLSTCSVNLQLIASGRLTVQ